jgi:hypothetical protein
LVQPQLRPQQGLVFLTEVLGVFQLLLTLWLWLMMDRLLWTKYRSIALEASCRHFQAWAATHS